MHRYGAHIFHTSDEEVWEYVTSRVRFNNYINSPVAIYHDELYNLPFNMNTFAKAVGDRPRPSRPRRRSSARPAATNIGEPKNLEEQALKLVGDDIYQKLVKGYTEKQWGRDCKRPSALYYQTVAPCGSFFDNNYFTDRYQGIPEEGYDALVQKLLEGSEVLLSTEYTEFVEQKPGDRRQDRVYRHHRRLFPVLLWAARVPLPPL